MSEMFARQKVLSAVAEIETQLNRARSLARADSNDLALLLLTCTPDANEDDVLNFSGDYLIASKVLSTDCQTSVDKHLVLAKSTSGQIIKDINLTQRNTGIYFAVNENATGTFTFDHVRGTVGAGGFEVRNESGSYKYALKLAVNTWGGISVCDDSADAGESFLSLTSYPVCT